jgi:predicted metalloprotease with PDZ domain
MVDVRVREETHNARSLDDVLRAVVATGADVEAHWDVTRLLDVGDAATGTHVLHAVYRELGLAPGTVDLPALWRQLGVKVDADRVTFDDTAPLATVRRGIAGR